jgi:hypothetical protein
MRRGRVKIRVKIIVLETVPLEIEMRSRRVKIRVKIIVLEPVPFQIEMKGRRVKIRVKIIVPETVAKWQKVAFKRLPARIWPKTANGGISTRIRMRVNIILLHGGNPGPRKEKDKTTRKRNPRKCLDFFHGWLDMIVLETVLIFSGEKACWRS